MGRSSDTRRYVHESATMANRQNYDVVVDVDNEGDLGHTDLNDDLEFHNSTFDSNPSARGASKVQPDQSSFLQPPSGSRGQQSTSKRYLWSIAFYQQFFDIDTNQLLHRCKSTLYSLRIRLWAAVRRRGSHLRLHAVCAHGAVGHAE